VFLKSLNKLQLDAATYGAGPLLVLAGAGSGKTKVLTSRIAHLILNKKAGPQNILAVTFTNKAAREIKERLVPLIGERTDELWAGTFHTIGLRILREERKAGGDKTELTIYDEEEQALLIRLVMSEMSINERDVPYKAAQFEINMAKNGDFGPEELAYKSKHLFADVIAGIYREYEKRLSSMNALDFGDLITKPLRLFKKSPEVLEKYRERFHHILVDEYQDTNRSQYQLTKLLAGKKRDLFAVGDPDQSIYGWRGATIENILNFRNDYPDARVIKLEQNYRSTKNILSAANSVIKNNGERLDKTLWTDNSGGEPVHYEECMNEYGEARFVVNRVRNLMSMNPGTGYRDFTVLYRTNTQSRPFEEMFFEEGVPYTIVGGYRFFDRREIKDALAYLKALQNPDDSLNFLRIINVPPRGIGRAALEKAHGIAKTLDLSLYGAFKQGIKDGVFKNSSIADFIGTFDILRSEISEMKLHEFTHRVLDLTGYLDMWAEKKTEDGLDRIKSLDGLVAAIKNYETGNPRATLADYLNLVSLMSDADQYEDKCNRVTLMTIHSAKGLEFPYVFIAGMEEGLFPHKRSIDEETIEEERRLCYVGMTRARKELYLLSAKQRAAGKETNTQAPSRFLKEIDPAFIRVKEPPPEGKAEDHIAKIRKLLGS
jgi:ATP-dependent DNA helicase UvrD/PcrA